MVLHAIDVALPIIPFTHIILFVGSLQVIENSVNHAGYIFKR